LSHGQRPALATSKPETCGDLVGDSIK
jgi:hypothetical protein